MFLGSIACSVLWLAAVSGPTAAGCQPLELPQGCGGQAQRRGLHSSASQTLRRHCTRSFHISPALLPQQTVSSAGHAGHSSPHA